MLTEAFDYSRERNGHAVLVLQDGIIIGEDYQNGYTQDAPHWIASCTKSLAGIILGKLVNDRVVFALSSRVAPVITEWESVPIKTDATLRKLLSLTSGMDGPPGTETPPFYENAINLSMTDPGTFKYRSSPFCVFGEYVNRLVNPWGFVSSWHYLYYKIFGPLGIAPSGIVFLKPPPDYSQLDLAGGGFFTARELAKVGEFMRRGGTTESGQSLISSSLIATMIGPGLDYWAYGLNWWRSSDQLGRVLGTAMPGTEFPAHGYAAAGLYGQYIFVLPDVNMTVVRFGGGSTNWVDTEFLDLVLGSQ